MLKNFLSYFNVIKHFNCSAVSGKVATSFLMAMEGLIVWISGTVTCVFIFQGSTENYLTHQLLIMLVSLLVIGLFYISNLYDFNSTADAIEKDKRIVGMIRGITLIFFMVMLCSFNVSTFSQQWLFVWGLVTLVTLCLERASVYYLLKVLALNGHLTRQIVIFGVNGFTGEFMDAVQNDRSPWVKVTGLFDDRLGRTPATVNGSPVVGNIDELVRYVRDNRCYEVFVLLPLDARARIDEISMKLKLLPVPVRLIPSVSMHGYTNHKIEYFNGIPTLEILNKPLSDWDYLIKLAEDRLLGLFFCLLLAPVYLLISIMIKMDSPGPVFFKQKRYGYNNRLIEVYKFRSMYVNQADIDAKKLVTRDDPRVTKLGAFLRRSSLDEIPQFFNVLKGEMSIVGPRPHALSASAEGKLYEVAVAGYAERHKVKPGVTGWAQVNGWRGETDTEEKILKRVEYDIDYIKNWSLFLDLFIIFRTVFVVLDQKNAY
ncbi:Undecaprenyl-phosphate glucose phosphotransferase [Crenothrix polyspora]|uniref:Undecaprenyl-phosphate glucose phosphotransferase n=1 Tax=Crenothrix polyspora TaxID=360316 RepID=A0A1R4GZX6_9GAMM|nr:undecaprenyl-phosphate glucose phosphotransferase [Crenothrix polyspora]SJM89506.1 Undecaprenyl-phosphate glucose phosphotransferase [Crenothrix polyspora]